MYSQLMRALKSRFTITGEINPPKGCNIEEVIQQGEKFKGHVDAVNITDNPIAKVRMNTLAPCIALKKIGLDVVYQMTCRDRNRIALQSDVLGAAAMGIHNVLALTGDHTMLGDHPQARAVFDLDSVQLTAMIHKMVHEKKDLSGNELSVPPKMHIGVASSPALEPLELEIIKLEKKVDAGAEFVQTQAVYDIDILERFIDATSHLDVHILVGIMPLKSVGMAKFLNSKVPGISIPDEIFKRLKNAANFTEETITLTKELISCVKDCGASGVHIMGVGTWGPIFDVIDAFKHKK